MWKLLKSTEDWINYKRSTLRDCNAPDGFFDFGVGPVAYPCLIDTLIPAIYRNGSHLRVATEPPQQIKLHTAFVYVRDANMLLQTQSTTQPDVSAVVAPVAKQQERFNMWVAASLLTVAKYLTTTGLCAPRTGLEANEAAYEATLEEMFNKVLALRADQVNDLASLLTPHERVVLKSSDVI